MATDTGRLYALVLFAQYQQLLGLVFPAVYDGLLLGLGSTV